MINYKKFLRLNRLTIAIIILLILLVMAPITYSRFQSNIDPEVKIETAFYVLDAGYQTQTIKLDNLVPSSTEHVYQFTVANNKDNKRCEVDMEYEVILTATTNLPLTISLGYANDNTNILTTNEIVQDADGMYLKRMVTNKVTFSHETSEQRVYSLKVVFPNLYTDMAYQDIIEGIMISVNSRQVIEENVEESA